ncbi:MAG TPA: hypothetical protein VJ385_06395 [Fibrobacteria bacterium]|nr:hypothetical protein [Fibrobacteria bacterium]
MNLVEVIQPTPDVIRLFLEPRLQAGNFVLSLLTSLGQEKANNFANVNHYLDSSLGDSFQTLEGMGDFQFQLEQTKPKGFDRELEAEYAELKAKAQGSLVELHRAKIKLNDLKIALCRFIINHESPTKTGSRIYHSVEEWMDAAALAEMRLARAISPTVDRNLQRLLALFMTFRSIVCSYDGPSMYIRQMENSLASLDAIYEKIRLEMEVLKATRTLVETRRELSTAKINLTSLQNQLHDKAAKDERLARLMSLQEKSAFPQIFIIGACLVALSGLVGYFLTHNLQTAKRGGSELFSQRSCREIERQLDKSPRYKSQVLIFRKFGREIFFRANAATCEKLYRLDSLQIGPLSDVLQADFQAGNQAEASYNGNRLLQVKDVGINKLVVKLSNRTEKNVEYKLKVLERATQMRAILEPDKDGLAEDLLIVDLTVKPAPEKL